ncbi:MAG TPA: alpha/beta hydrolase, partial [Deinococcales bacterium]|nr:alpha/beta hydrolase [Deinococcales bacterium]
TRAPGPLVVAAPGIGDLRQSYRFLVPMLARAGFRVVTVDLPGQGESSTGWPDATPEAFGEALAELVAHLNAGPAVLIGNSYAAASVSWTAARHPQAVRGVVLIGPVVRDVPASPVQKLLIPVLFSGPWKVAAWLAYWSSLFPARKPADHAAYRARLRASLNEPGRFAALKALMNTGRARVQASLKDITAPVLVVMGARDPDFKDPAAEARAVAELTRGRVALIPQAGHYPQAEQPDATLAALLPFLAETTREAERA